MDKICLSVDIGSKNIVIANKEKTNASTLQMLPFLIGSIFCMLFAASAPQATYEYLLLTFAVATTLGSLRITCDSLFASVRFSNLKVY